MYYLFIIFLNIIQNFVICQNKCYDITNSYPDYMEEYSIKQNFCSQVVIFQRQFIISVIKLDQLLRKIISTIVKFYTLCPGMEIGYLNDSCDFEKDIGEIKSCDDSIPFYQKISSAADLIQLAHQFIYQRQPLNESKYIYLEEYQNEQLEVYGAAVYDFIHDQIVITFRGTRMKYIQNMMMDANIQLVDTDFCDGCQVHKGFLKAYDSVRQVIQLSLEKIIQTFPKTNKLMLTGHSLGGALVNLIAADLVKTPILNKYEINIVTYGCPRVGNQKWSKFMDQKFLGKHQRIIFKDDPLSQVPMIFQGYIHSGFLINYSNGTKFFSDQSLEDFQTYHPFSIIDHTLYDQIIV